jgi:hypothetical protein
VGIQVPAPAFGSLLPADNPSITFFYHRKPMPGSQGMKSAACNTVIGRSAKTFRKKKSSPSQAAGMIYVLEYA